MPPADPATDPAADSIESIVARAEGGTADDRAACVALAEPRVFAALGRREGSEIAPLLRRLCATCPTDSPAMPRAWWLLGIALHDAQDHAAAGEAMAHAARLAPRDPRARLGDAQLRYETGRPAAAAFAALHADAPGDRAVLRNLAGALAAEGRADEAEAVLERALGAAPGWLDGQVQLATLRRTAGDADMFDRGFAAAVAAGPADVQLRLGWFHLLAKAKAWGRAGAVIDAAARDLGDRPAFAIARLFLASESGASSDPALFAAVESSADPGLVLARIRHALRHGRADAAAALAERHVGGPATPTLWPYLSLAWRVLGDPRAAWLDRPDTLVRSYDLGLTAAELADLATLLRSLHTMAAPYLDQSVRGGTQTDRPLLFRHEAIVARARAAILDAVRAYVDALPPPEPDHPLLSAPRADLRFAGSWSVRLSAQGFHACHTHPAGWISSACYVALPDPMGAPPAGWLHFGTPPPELNLALPACHAVEPRVGRLVLFPSTLWHGTAPFADGERLSIAFDIARPRW